MGDWLKLTEADIEAAQEALQSAPITPAVIQIGADDLPPEDAAPPVRRTEHTIRITEADLTAVSPQSTAPPDLITLEQITFGLINIAREKHLPGWLTNAKLRWHPGLAAVARGHAADMQQRQYISHQTPEGINTAQRLDRYGIRYLACGENIGVVYGAKSHSQEGIYEVHNTFMQQPRSLTNHRGNLLNPLWTHVGVGVAYKPDGALFVTQNFISAPGAK